MMKNFFHGLQCVRRGFTLIREPGVRRYAVVPLLINIIVYVFVGWLLFTQFTGWIDGLTPLNRWESLWIIQALKTVIEIVLGGGLLLAALYTFTLVANLIGAPFNGLLAEKVEARLRGTALDTGESWGAVIKSVPISILSELRKWLYVIFWLIPIGLLHLIPGLQVIAPFLLLAFGAWVFALEYLDYPMGNHGFRFGGVRKLARQQRASALGFGSGVALLTAIPVLSLIAMPVAVAGATALYVERYDRPPSD